MNSVRKFRYVARPRDTKIKPESAALVKHFQTEKLRSSINDISTGAC